METIKLLDLNNKSHSIEISGDVEPIEYFIPSFLNYLKIKDNHKNYKIQKTAKNTYRLRRLEKKNKKKTSSHHHDVFLCYNTDERLSVIDIEKRLIEMNIKPWLDIRELRPGFPWQPKLEEKIETIGSAAIIIGHSGIGPWQNHEIMAFIRNFIHRNCPVIPIILDNCETEPKIPTFLDAMVAIDFRKDSNPYDLLYWGITGNKP